MSTSTIEAMHQVDINVSQCENNIPQWLHSFLGKTFFDKCPTHDLQKNDINRYCITCDAIACKYCITSYRHGEHKLLTIYRHVYQDVVALSEMENHMNCTKIQPYKCNKKWVVSLTPLPHNGSGLLIEGDGACSVCRRKLTDPGRFRFCSIACKVEAVSGRKNTTRGLISGEGTSGREEYLIQPLNQGYRKRSRKGIPFRAS